MKKYIKPTAEIIELSIKESLSDVPSAFSHPNKARFSFGMSKVSGSKYKNISIYTYSSNQA